MFAENCPSRDVLLALHRGELAEEPAQGVLDHLSGCPACQAVVETFRDADDTLPARLREPAESDPYTDEPQCHEALARAQSILAAQPMPSGQPGDPSPPPLFPPPSPLTPLPSPLSPLPAPALPQWGEYQLLEKLGEGGMGAVYKARHTELDRVVAIKLLPGGRLQTPAAVARFRREIKLIGQLNHPNMVQAHDAREVEGVRFLVMEYVEGVNLSELVGRCGPLPVADACELVRQAAVGLQHAHEHGLVHRDIKPSNLMLSVGQAFQPDKAVGQGFQPDKIVGATAAPSAEPPARQAGKPDLPLAPRPASLAPVPLTPDFLFSCATFSGSSLLKLFERKVLVLEGSDGDLPSALGQHVTMGARNLA